MPPEVRPAITLPAGMQGQLGPLFRIIKDQRVAFVIVGGMNTVIGTAWFILFELLFGERIGRFGYLASLGCAHVAAVISAFILYRTFVFRVRGHIWLDLFRFWLVNLSALGINAVALPTVVEITGLRAIYAQLLVTCFTAFISFFGHKYFSFRRGSKSEEREAWLSDGGANFPDGGTGTREPVAVAGESAREA